MEAGLGMHIKRLRLKNFRGFEDAELDFEGRRLTVLFGVNGSGKSSVLAALVCVCSDLLKQMLKSSHGWGLSLHSEDLRLRADHMLMEVNFSSDELCGAYRLQYDRNRSPIGKWLSAPPSLIGFLPIFFEAERRISALQNVLEETVREAELRGEHRYVLSDALFAGTLGFQTFFNWFKEREDAENRLKVQSKNLNASDPQLNAVRTAIQNLLPGFSDLRIQHDPLRLEVRKGEQTLSINQLSDGEKIILAMSADIARRLAMRYPNAPDPLQKEAIVMVDEVELHLHPAWQRRVLPAWLNTFPNAQFIVTTHSPQVISEVPADSVFCIDHFQFVRPGAPTLGRDSNAILEEVMNTPERPESVKQKLQAVSEMIDREHYRQAGEALDALAREISERDHEIVRLRTMLRFMVDDHAMDTKEQ